MSADHPTPPDDAEARRIAERLTAAQRKALLWLPADGSWTSGRVPREFSGGCSSLTISRRGAEGSWDMGVVGKVAARMRYRLDDLGRRVRAILQEADHAGA
jgi:hypothetical protein